MRSTIKIPENVPFDQSVLYSLLGGYRSAKDKITRLEREGEVIRLRRGLYIAGNMSSDCPGSRELIANHLYSPSYVSYEYALSFHGIIPEQVYLIRSSSLLRSRQFSTPLGEFAYVYAKPEVFPAGIMSVQSGNISFMIATPEKALCDLIMEKKGLRIQSLAGMVSWLEEDLRCDTSLLHQFNSDIIQQCIAIGAKKQNELRFLLKYLTV